MTDVLRMLQEGLAGRYTVERELGRGGMAAVFLARDIRHDRLVALKVLHPELAMSIGTDRFVREIRFAARLQHPHILPVHDSGDVPGTGGEPTLLWFSMPYVDGESLRQRLARDRQLSLAEAIRITREVADALEYAHRQGLIHRDIKPENILLSGGHALVTDFGVARALAPGTGEHAALTGTGLAIGTPAYMSPEQATGDQSLDNRSDLYSLGCVLYEMLAGEPPFGGATAQVILARVLTEAPRPLRSIRPGVPPVIEQVVAGAIARSPADRYPSVAEFSRELEAAAAQITTPGGGTLVSPSPLRRRRVPLFALLGIGFLLGLGVLFAWRERQSGTPADGPVLLAVLPFENMGDSGDAYFADGMTDEVRGKLSSLPDFQVIARTSSAQYRGTTKPLKDVARELGVRYLLTGTVRWIKTGGANRVQVRPELVEVVKSGATVGRWERPFDAALDDVFKVQADIAGQVAVALKGELAAAAMPSTMTAAPTSNTAAYDEFLRGEQSYYGSSGSVSLRQAADHYEAATTLDTAFARAWSRLAMVRASMYINSDASLAVAEAARSAGERALRLAPRLPESYLALGNYYSLVRADFPHAIEQYNKGLVIAPAHAELLGALGLAEQGLGKVDDGLAHMRQGLALDPRSLLYTRRLARLLTYARRYDEAEALLARARAQSPTDASVLLYQAWLRLSQGDLAGARAVARSIPKDANEPSMLSFFSPDWSSAQLLDEEQRQLLLRLQPSQFGDNRGNWGLALAYGAYMKGDLRLVRAYADSALPRLERAVRENPSEPSNHKDLGTALAFLGRKADAIREGERAVTIRGNDGFQGPGLHHSLSRIYQLVGEPVKAIEQLEGLLRVPYMVSPGWLRADPSLDPLRSHPQFQRLLAVADTVGR
jgi:serine/threonine protein kinase/tetratricopeptide (TPR) repeat protein